MADPQEPSAETPAEDDEDLAAAWGDALAEADPAAAATPPRLLDQAEIDNLLGAANAKASKDEPGILSVINANHVIYERLPMLEVVLDRLERLLSTSLRNFTSENVEISLDAISARRFGNFMESIPLPAMIGVFKAVEWDNYGLMTVDSAMIYSIVDVLLGGGRSAMTFRVDGRPYTTIEAALVERLMRLILHDLTAAFAPVTPVTLRFDRIETTPRFAAIATQSNACVVFKLRIELEERGGNVEFLIPYATLEPARDKLLQMFMGEKFGRDSIWEHHLAREVWATQVDLEAVLSEQSISLNEVMNFKVGTVLQLSARPDSKIAMRSGDITLMYGRMGRVGDNIAVCIEDKLDPQARSSSDQDKTRG